MDVLDLGDDRAIVAGNVGLVLLEVAALPPGGTQDYLGRLTGLNARDIVTGETVSTSTSTSRCRPAAPDLNPWN